jgi:L-2-hydroxyglutarate oxidase LhgO
MSDELDTVIIGAGAVGLAVAWRLSRTGQQVVVLERQPRHGLETSSRNSEVIHAGLYYPSSSLKARLCVHGRRTIYDLGARHGFFYKKTGKLIVACEDSETSKLEDLLRQGQENGVEGLRIVEASEVASLAPGVKAVAGLWSPETGIVDTEELMSLYLSQAQAAGAIFLWNSPLSRVERLSRGYRLWVEGSKEAIEVRCVVNAAGLHADRVAELGGIDTEAAGYGLSWFKGEYFSLRRSLPIGTGTLVYPLPGSHGLGIHLTVDRLGRQRLGPNSFLVESLDYGVNPAHAEAFCEAASRYLPGLKTEDLQPGTSGIRPKLSRDGSFRDFLIAEESSRGLPGWVNLIGIESPGLTASPAIADLVSDLLR